MSTLKTHNLQSPDAGSVNISLAPNAGMVVTGISTFSDDVKLTVANGHGILIDKSASQFNVNSGTVVRFQNGNEVNTDDGKIGTAMFASGLNIVGSQTASGLGRQIRLYGDLLADSIKPTADSTYNIGTSSNRFANAFTDALDVKGTSVVANIMSTNNNNVLGIAGNNASVKAYLGTDSSGNFLIATGSTPAERLRITTGGVLTFPTAGIGLHNSNTNSYFFSQGSNETRLYHAANNQVKLAFRKNGDVYQGAVNADDNGIGFFTKSTGSAGEEWGIRCKPDSETELFYNGNVRLYTTNQGISINSNTLIAATDADDIQIGDGSGNAGITIYSSTSNNGAIYFGDGTGGTNPYSGFLQYYHASNSFGIGTLGGEKVLINSVGRQMNRCTTRFNREAYTKGGTIYGGGAATGANTSNPGAFVFLNNTPVRGSNTRYSFWMQSGDEYPNSSNFIDIDIGNSYMYRVLIKGSHSSVTAEMAMFLIYGLANSSGNYAPRIQQVTTTTPSFNGDSGGSGSFALNSGQFNCRVMGYGTSGGTRGSLGTYNTTLRIEYTGSNNQGLLAFIERWDTGT